MWFCAGNGVDNSGMFSLLLSSAYTAKAFLASHTVPPVSRLEAHKSLGVTQLGHHAQHITLEEEGRVEHLE